MTPTAPSSFFSSRKRFYVGAKRLVLSLSLGLFSGAGLAAVVAQDISDDLMISKAFLDTEQQGRKLIRAAFSAPDGYHLPLQYQAWKLVELSARDAALVALQKNLTIEQARLGSRIVNQALVQAEALFDPTLSASFSYDRNRVFSRKETDFKFKKATVTNFTPEFSTPTGGAGAFLRPIANPESPVEYIEYDKVRPAGYYPTTRTSSEDDLTLPDGIQTYNLSVSQLLPWGSWLSLSLKTVNKDRIYANNADAGESVATFGKYERPWDSALTASLVASLPFTKNFGKEAAEGDVNLKLAQIAVNRQRHTADQIITATLKSVDDAYHDLVRSMIAVQAGIGNLGRVDRLAEKTRAMFDRQEITALEKAQVDSEVFRVRGVVEDRWNAYIRSSNEVRRLLNVSESVVYVPTGYLANLRRTSAFHLDGDNAVKVTDSPSYKGAQLDMESSAVVLRRDELHMRPDVSFSAKAAFSQGTTFGYETYVESLSNVIAPDTIIHNYSVTYYQPLGRRADTAQLETSKHAHAASRLAMRQAESAVRLQLANGLVNHSSAKRRVEISERGYELALLAYDKAATQQGSRGVTEYELVLKSQDVLSAHSALISALVDMKKAESAVLAASGQLAENYASRTAQMELDRERVRELQKSGAVNFFADAGR